MIMSWWFGSHKSCDLLQAYCTSTHCRHAVMVNHFEPAAMPPVPEGGCEGGCDNCERRETAGSWVTKDFGKQVSDKARAYACTVQ